jgi:SAM-dependent methyltransferase
MARDHPARDVNRHAVTEFVRRTAVSIPEGARVLDAGAGEARYRRFFAGRRYLAVDLAIGDPEWDYGGLDVLADLTRLPFPDASFDHVLTTQTLEHLAEPAAFLAEAARVLRPGGRIHLTAPQCQKLHQAPHDYYRYTEFGLRHLLSNAGFVVESVTAQGGYLAFLADAIRPLHRKLFGRERSLAWRILAAPVIPVSKLLFTRLVPLCLLHLDPLDTKRAMTTGHEAVARKPGGGEAA